MRIGEKLRYFCKFCQQEYTIPDGDILIEKNKSCRCGRPSDRFGIKKTILIDYDYDLPIFDHNFSFYKPI